MAEPRIFDIPAELVEELEKVINEQDGLGLLMTALTKQSAEISARSRATWSKVLRLYPDMTERVVYDPITKTVREKS